MLFTLDELKPQGATGGIPQSRDAALSCQFLAFHRQKIGKLQDLGGKLPMWNEGLFLWTELSFNAFTFVPYIIQNSGAIVELVITSYSISIEVVNALMQLVDEGKIQKVRLFISDSIRHRLPRVADLLDSLIRARAASLEVRYAWNHSKILLAKTEWDWLVMEGSGNFAKNAQFEQYAVFNSAELYQFRLQCIEDGFNARSAEAD